MIMELLECLSTMSSTNNQRVFDMEMIPHQREGLLSLSSNGKMLVRSVNISRVSPTVDADSRMSVTDALVVSKTPAPHLTFQYTSNIITRNMLITCLTWRMSLAGGGGK